MSFEKVLVANRGEIACRVLQSARSLGYRTVAVFSEADAGARHVQLADEAVCIGPATAAESYLNVPALLDACRRSGADAVHPGYGFLSENADFAAACAEAGVTFIGPPAEAIRLMGSKRLSKIAMQEAGVPCVPGYQGEDQSDDTLIKEAEAVGLPLMIKASAGGGGRGMRVVTEPQQIAAQLKSARQEAKSSFGNDELILERAVINPRHVEIQVFGDHHGNVIHLGERDCSVQRRHQKVVEEAPSPVVDEDLRRRMGEAAVNAAKACDYVGAGTVEFLLGADGEFYFLEMNTRLQVEHPVTELVTGQDLVAWQLRVASGEPLPLTQEQVRLTGHAMEVRLYAEDPAQGYLPQTGPVLSWRPASGEGVRIDHGLVDGAEVGSHYDPMLAKIIAFGASRDEARRRLIRAVEDTVLMGLDDNRRFLAAILRHPEFAAGDATTAFIDGPFADDPGLRAADTPEALWALAALLLTRIGAGDAAGVPVAVAGAAAGAGPGRPRTHPLPDPGRHPRRPGPDPGRGPPGRGPRRRHPDRHPGRRAPPLPLAAPGRPRVAAGRRPARLLRGAHPPGQRRRAGPRLRPAESAHGRRGDRSERRRRRYGKKGTDIGGAGSHEDGTRPESGLRRHRGHRHRQRRRSGQAPAAADHRHPGGCH